MILASDWRAVFTQAIKEDLSYADVAATYEIALATVNSKAAEFGFTLKPSPAKRQLNASDVEHATRLRRAGYMEDRIAAFLGVARDRIASLFVGNDPLVQEVRERLEEGEDAGEIIADLQLTPPRVRHIRKLLPTSLQPLWLIPGSWDPRNRNKARGQEDTPASLLISVRTRNYFTNHATADERRILKLHNPAWHTELFGEK